MLEKNGENREIIGVDLDETLCYTVKEVIEHNKLTIGETIATEDHITDYYLHNIPGMGVENEEEAVRLFKEVFYKDILRHEISPVIGAKEKLIELKNKGFEIDVVTARDYHLWNEYTSVWLKKYYPDIFYKIHYANKFGIIGNQIPKSELCKQNGINIMIEDNLDYAIELARNGILTYLLHKPWNYRRNDKHENLIRVEHWGEIEI